MIMKNKIKKFIKKRMQRKVPVSFPIMFGSLLKGKTAFITGGNSGIGLEIAKAFLRNGASVIISGSNEKKLKKAYKILTDIDSVDTSQKIETFKLDLLKVEEINEKVNPFLENKHIDILVNSAGILKDTQMGGTKIEEFEDCIKVNLEAIYFISQTFTDYFIKNKIEGNILNITSSSALRPAINPYVLSKQGLKALTEGMAKKFIKYGIVVNGLAPGPTATNMLLDLKSDSDVDINLASNPSGRYVMPEEVANIAVILVSQLGRMIVGDTIYITGGAGNITFDDTSY